MQVTFPYGEESLTFQVDEDLDYKVIRAKSEEPYEDPKKEIEEAISHPTFSQPLQKILEDTDTGKVCIVISDSTRPVPSKSILEVILKICEQKNIPDHRIQILIATGLHRKTTPDELKKMLGEDILLKYDIINHVAEDEDNLKYLGENSFDTPVYINKHYIDASVKIITGYVEPHFFAGYSGGRKAIVPGVAGSETILQNHSPKNIASPYSRFGVLDGNPIYEDALDTAKMKEVIPDFMVNVCINPDHQITKVVAGGIQAHYELVQYQDNLVFDDISDPYDVVITTNGGYPLDLNLYQAVKSMAIGELAVKEGGTIISINECRDGVGQEKFDELINMDMSPQELFEKVTNREIWCKDSWEIQVLTRVLSISDVYVISEMDEEELGTIGLKYAESVEKAIERSIQKYGRDLRILILPDGPMAIPKLNG